MSENAYTILDLPRNATAEQINSRRKTLMRAYHPDIVASSGAGDPAAMSAKAAAINAAADLLLNPSLRAALDLDLRRAEGRGPSAAGATSAGSTSGRTSGSSAGSGSTGSSSTGTGSRSRAQEAEDERTDEAASAYHFDWTAPTAAEMAANHRDWHSVSASLRFALSPGHLLPWLLEVTLRDPRGQWWTQSLLVLLCLGWPAPLPAFTRVSLVFTFFPLLALCQSAASRRIAGTPLSLVIRITRLSFLFMLAPLAGVGRLFGQGKGNQQPPISGSEATNRG